MLDSAMGAALIRQASSFVYTFVLSKLNATRRFVQKTSECSIPLVVIGCSVYCKLTNTPLLDIIYIR